MLTADFDIYKDLLKTESGIIITPDKAYLLDSRLTPVARRWGHEDLDAMAAALRGAPDKRLVKEIVEAMTTNETSFFRDTRPFNLFKHAVLPYITQQRQNTRRLKIWCAACSSGQEPYSLSMILKEEAEKHGVFQTDILGTDISEDILEQARTAIYSQFEVQRGLPIQLLMKYFEQTDKKWQLKDDIRKMVRYRYFNLLDSMTMLGTFDIIFCRNVLIYFDEATKRDILGRMSKCLAPDGVLYLGGAETVLGVTDAFKPITGVRGLYAHADSEIALTVFEQADAKSAFMP